MVRRSALLVALALSSSNCGRNEPPPTPPDSKARAVDPIPEGYFTLTPQLTVNSVDEAADFYITAFGAELLSAIHDPSGKTVHARIRIGDSIVMIEREDIEQGNKAPTTLGGTPVTLMLYLDDADAAYAKAINAGGTADEPIEERFWGDRYGELSDPFGHRWAVATHVEDLTPDQLSQRAALAMKSKSKKSRRRSRPPKWRSIAGNPAADPTPAPYHTLTIALTSDDALGAIEFYKAAFNADERQVLQNSDGKVIHGALMIGDSILLIHDEDRKKNSAVTLGGSPVTIHMYVVDVDSTFAMATGARGKVAAPVAEMFSGDRYGAMLDTSGFTWGLASRVEELTPREMEQWLRIRGS